MFENDETNGESAQPAPAPVTNRRAVRGKAALLLANSNQNNDSSNSSSSDDESGKKTNGKSNGLAGGGIYAKKLLVTKQQIKEQHIQASKIDTFSEVMKAKSREEKEQQENETSSDNDCCQYYNGSSHDDDHDQIKENVLKGEKAANNKKIKVDNNRPESPTFSPPPPPIALATAKLTKRKSSSLVNKQLKELERLKQETNLGGLLNDSDPLISNAADDDIINTITVKVMTKNGICKWEIHQNEPFKKIFQELSKKENVNVENILLMLNERKIHFDDTPASIDLKIYDILDFSKVAQIVEERIKIIENSTQDDDDGMQLPANSVIVILQTQDGRKSRLKFLISKDEKFKNVLAKYCERLKLDQKYYMMEFDGDKVGLDETPTGLDLDGGEIFDVKRSSKPTLQKIAENKKNYEFDDDILPA